MTFKEHNNRQIANNFAEYITSETLRRYLADKVKKYCGDDISVFDGAAGSGQLEQFIKPSEFHAVEIQDKACQALLENYPNAIVSNQSFFTYDSNVKVDAICMNPPFSLKFKDLPEEDKEAIQALYPWKKSGVVDDIFMLKSMNYSNRFGFFIMFPGITYRKTERKMRELIGTQLVELNQLENGFEDTPINVVFIVVDKEKKDTSYTGEIYDAKTGKVLWQEKNELSSDYSWLLPRIIEEKEEIDIDAVNKELDDSVVAHIERHLASNLVLIEAFNADIDYVGFINRCRKVLDEYELLYNFKVPQL